MGMIKNIFYRYNSTVVIKNKLIKIMKSHCDFLFEQERFTQNIDSPSLVKSTALA